MIKPEFVFLILWGGLLLCAFLWFFTVGWVNASTHKTKRNVKLWNTILFFFCPISLIVYLPFFISSKKKIEDNPAQNLELFKQQGEPLLSHQYEEQESLASVRSLLTQALDNQSTDIHLEPKGNLLSSRFRIDGLLHDGPVFPQRTGLPIVSAFKVLAHINIAEKRKPQDGSFTAKIKGRTVNFRVSTTSSFYGETMVIRILDSENGLINLGDLGLLPEDKEKCSDLLSRSHGMILVVGPSANGKTTTLYAILNEINIGEKNIISIEDPIEYELPNVTQIPINPKAGVDFAGSLRSILRQDPDVIMVGEIRDAETAEMAFRSSLTGHLVLSTLHTTEAAGAITRLMDMRLEPYLISSSLVGVLAQRLVRVLCSNCKTLSMSYHPDELSKKGLQLEEEDTLYEPVGCEHCRQTGYRSRVGIFELLIVDKEIKDLITKRASTEDIFTRAREKGMTSMKEDGWQKVKQGITTVAEVERVLL
jgi:type II secretory ATPase GspE/PulE/Tfp pilus assembly ATPase PilB-like protein